MYRAYYAIPKNFKTSRGEQTNAVYGVASMVLSMLRLEEPDAVVFAFDAGEETFRHKEHTEYKAGRAETPDDFFIQIPRIQEMIGAFGFASVSDRNYEADDFLCAYAKEGEKKGMKVTIVTGDRDALQLATDKVRIAIPHKGYQKPEYLGPNEILAKYGIRPDQVPSYKGLCGDASDNLPGVMGIGPKGAAQLLQSYDTLEGIYAHLDDIKPGVRAKLEKDREQAFFCERMAQLVCDFPLPLTLENLALKDLPAERIRSFLQELEFQSLVGRFNSMLRTPYAQTHFRDAESSSATSQSEVVEDAASQMSLF